MDRQCREQLLWFRAVLAQLGGPLNPGFTYTDQLYPLEALSILAVSRADGYQFQPDDLLEQFLGDWLRERRGDARDFTRLLFAAIQDRDCADGTIWRLNHYVTAPYNIRGWSPAKCREEAQSRRRIGNFLRENKTLVRNADKIYMGLAKVHQRFDLEQSLLSWMGYIVIKRLAALDAVPVKYHGNRLMLPSGTP